MSEVQWGHSISSCRAERETLKDQNIFYLKLAYCFTLCMCNSRLQILCFVSTGTDDLGYTAVWGA